MFRLLSIYNMAHTSDAHSDLETIIIESPIAGHLHTRLNEFVYSASVKDKPAKAAPVKFVGVVAENLVYKV